MTDHALPVRPEQGDRVRVEYRSRRASDSSTTKHREGVVERVATGHTADGTHVHLLVREDTDRRLIASVRPSGRGGKAYSLNFNDDHYDDLQVVTFTTSGDGSTWRVRWAEAEKTQRVTLGRVEQVELLSTP